MARVEFAELSAAQQEFAQRERATPGLRSFVGVFLYREESTHTHRWLVALDGRLLDKTTFLKKPSGTVISRRRHPSSPPGREMSGALVKIHQ